MAQARKPKLSRQAKAAWASSRDRELWAKLPTEIREEINLAKGYSLRQNIIRPELGRDLFQLRAGLRHIWNKPNNGSEDIILMKWLAWRPSPAHLKAYQCSPFPDFVYPSFYNPFHCSVEAARLIPDSETIRGNLIQGVFEHWPNFKFCANPDCAAPYFIAKRKDQTVCDAGICKAEKQRQHALRWWNENRAKKSPKGDVKKRQTKKASKGNVTHKTR
jgi:hypothetical protein